MKTQSSTLQKTLAVIRILLGVGMLFFGIMKILNAGNSEMIEMVGSAGHAMGLTFLSITIRFWIATLGEIIAGALLLTGHRYKIGAILTIIIMIFAIRAVGPGAQPIIFLLASLLILRLGAGMWTLCPCKGCKGGCCAGKTSCCGGSDNAQGGNAMQQQ